MNPANSHADTSLPESLSILVLARPLLQPDPNDDPSQNDRAILLADLAHYRDLFSKLRFSYVEQVTKERFLKSITADPPAFVDPSENAGKEAALAKEKASLKEHKEEVREMIKGLEEQGKSLAERYELLKIQTLQLNSLPHEIIELETVIAQLQAAQEPKSADPDLALPLQPTLDLLSDKEAEVNDLNRQIDALQQVVSSRKDQIERLEDDLVALRTKKETFSQAA